VVEIDESAVDDDRRLCPLDAVFGNQSELRINALAAFGQKRLEGAADGSFMVDVELAKLVQGLVVSLDGGMRRLEGKRRSLPGKP